MHSVRAPCRAVIFQKLRQAGRKERRLVHVRHGSLGVYRRALVLAILAVGFRVWGRQRQAKNEDTGRGRGVAWGGLVFFMGDVAVVQTLLLVLLSNFIINPIIVMNGVISDHTAHIYLAQDPSVTTSSGAFCGDYTTYSTSVLSKRHPRK